MRGVSLEELSSATRINARFLIAIENGHWEELPGGAFNRGFIRSASRYLGLDEDGMVAEYSLETKGDGTWNAEIRPIRSRRNGKRLGIWGAALILLLAGLWLVGSKTIARLRAHRPTVSSATGIQKSGVAAGPAPGAAAPLELTVRGVSVARLRVVADGNTVADDSIQPNQEQHFRAKKSFQVSASDGSAVHLELNGHAVPQMGSSGLPGTITLTAKDVKSSAGVGH